MEIPRRFIFRGQATGVAAHIRRPVNQILPVHGASALPVTGGLSESKIGRKKVGEYVSFQSVSTSARGDFIDEAAAEAMTRGEVAFDAVPTQTTVTSQVYGLKVRGRLSIGLIEATLVSNSPERGTQLPVYPRGIKIDQVVLDKSVLRISLAESFYAEHHTKELLCRALAGETGAKYRAQPESNGIIYSTLVERMEWEGRPHPSATIEGNALIIPDFGTAYFGELLTTDVSRRLTMVRMQLGSPVGGDVAASEVETNGSFYPA